MDVQVAIFVAVSVIMAYASFHDLRSRKVPDICPKLLFLLAAVQLFLVYDWLPAVIVAFGYLMIYMYVFTRWLEGRILYVVLAAGVLALIFAWFRFGAVGPLITAVLFMLFLFMFTAGFMIGGGDVKVLIGLSMLYPTYPDFGGMIWMNIAPYDLVFNPVLATMIPALLLTVIWMIPVWAINIRTGTGTISSCMMDVKVAKHSFVYPAVGRRYMFRKEEDIRAYFNLMEKSGEKMVAVTPMIPFVVPLTMAFLLTMILGSPFFALI